MSSTWLDLKPERLAIEKVLQRLRETKYIGMEYFGSREETTAQVSLDEVDHSHVYVGIFAGRYGSGITEAEYRRARERGLTCLIYFKDEAAIMPEARDQESGQGALATVLKQELQNRHTCSYFSTPDELAAKVTADLHNWLFDKHLAPLLERAARGGLPRDEAQVILSAVKDPGALGNDLLSRLERVGIAVSGYRNVAAHLIRDSVVVTGDRNVVYQTIVQRYPELRDFLYDFSELVAEVTRDFVGREFVFDAIAAFLRRNKCGYFRIVADAGLGKTALAAEIARRHGATAFFANASSGLTRPDQCLNHLCSDLIARFGLDYGHLPARSGEDSKFLVQLLTEAAARSPAPIMLVVDGLDEADDPVPGRNCLLLPDRLPARVFVVVTQRPSVTAIATGAGTPIEELVISRGSTEQRQDVEAYLRRQSHQPTLRERLTAASVNPENFVALFATASEGNFKYLDYTIAEFTAEPVGEGGFDVMRLPHGLEGYYSQFWARMEATGKADGWTEWNQLFRPCMAFLAVAAEPVSLQWLATHVKREPEEILERVLVPWRRFLSCAKREFGETWRVVHRSFADFLGKRLDLEAMHRAIAAFYRADPLRWEEHGSYASRHLAWHLRHGRDFAGLFSLVDDSAWYHAQLAADVSGTLFLEDIGHAWSVADEMLLEAATDEARAQALGRSIRCALAAASVRSLSGQLPPELIRELVLSDVWKPTQALAVLRQTPGGAAKSRGIVELAAHLPEDLLGEVLEVARGIDRDWDLVRAVEVLAPRLPEQQLPRAWDMLSRLEDIAMRPHAARAVAARAPDSMLQDIINTALGERFWFKVHGVDVLAAIAGRLPQDVLNKTLERVLGREPGKRQARLLAELAPHLPDQAKRRAIDQALAGRGDDEHSFGGGSREWSRALTLLLPLLDDDTRARLLNEAVDAAVAAESLDSIAVLLPHLPSARRIELCDMAAVFADSTNRVYTLLEIAKYSSGYQRQAALSEAKRAASGMEEAKERIECLTAALALVEGDSPRDDVETLLDGVLALEISDRKRALERLAPYLPPELARRALTSVRDVTELELVALSRQLPGSERVETVNRALGLTRTIGDGGVFVEALRPLLRHLPESVLFDELPTVVRDAMASYHEGNARFKFIMDFPEEVQRRAIEEALRQISACEDVSSRAFSSFPLIPLLNGAQRQSVIDEAFKQASAIEEKVLRTQAIAELIPWLEEPSRAEAIRYVQKDTEAIVREAPAAYPSVHINALLAALPSLTETSKTVALTRALELALGVDDENASLALLEKLAPLLPAELFTRALRQVEDTSTESVGANLLAVLVPYLSADQVEKVLEVTGRLRRPFLRAGLLSIIGKFLHEPAMLQTAFEAALAIPDESYRSLTLAELAPYLTPDLIDRALAASRDMYLPETRAEALVALVPRSGDRWESALSEVLEIVPLIEEPEKRVSAMTALIPLLDGQTADNAQSEALDAALSVEQDDDRAEALLKLAPQLSETHIERLRQQVRHIYSDKVRADFLRDLSVKGLSPHAGPVLRPRFFQDALHTLAERPRRQFVPDLAVLSDALRAIGGAAAKKELALALVDTKRRWP